MATFQPLPSPPTTLAVDVRAPSKNTSLNSDVAGELADRPDLDAVLVHGHEQVRQALVLLGRVGGGRGAGEHEAPLGPVGQRGPHLLAGARPTRRRRARPGSRRWRGRMPALGSE